MDYFASRFTLKSLDDGGLLEGIASDPGLDLDGERIAAGAFTASLAEHKAAGTAPALLLHHNLSRPAGRWTDLADTAGGLAVKGRLTLDANDGREAYALLKGGALAGLSVGFTVDKETRDADGRRMITAGKLHEISLVTVPANPRARVTAIKTIANVRDLEDVLHEGGLSARKAKAAAGAAWRAINDTDEHDAAADAVAAILNASSRRLAGA